MPLTKQAFSNEKTPVQQQPTSTPYQDAPSSAPDAAFRPGTFSSDAMLTMQRTMGNQAVQNLLSGAKPHVGTGERGEPSSPVGTTARIPPSQKVVQRGRDGKTKETKQSPRNKDIRKILDLCYLYNQETRLTQWNGDNNSLSEIKKLMRDIYTSCTDFMKMDKLNDTAKEDWVLVRGIWNMMDRQMFSLRNFKKDTPTGISIFDYLEQAETRQYGSGDNRTNHMKESPDGKFLEYNYLNEHLKVQGPQAKIRQGWKIHVSATPENAKAVAALVLPILQGFGCEFKVVASTDELIKMMKIPGQAGKYVTIYPYNDTEALYIGRAVDKALQGQGLTAPHAGDGSEVQVGKSGLVFSRFGAYDGTVVSKTGVDADETEPDDRSKPYPSWKKNIWN